MATQTAIFDGLPTGLTLTAKVFDVDVPDTEVTVDDIDINEGTNAKGRYSVAITDGTALSGDYDIRLFVGSVPIAVGAFRFAGTNGETATEVPVTAELDSAIQAQIDAIETDAAASVGYLTTLVSRLTANAATAIQNLYHMITGTGASSKYTVAALENAPAGGGGAGDASQTTLLEVKAKTDLIGSASALTELLAAAVLEPGSITSFPEILRIGDSYTDILGRGIQVPIVDSSGTPLSSAGSKNFSDATATFVIKRANDTESTRIITGSATFIDPPGTGTGEHPYALIELPSSETAKGLVKYRYTGLLTFTWPYVGTGTDAEVMTFETGTITFEA